MFLQQVLRNLVTMLRGMAAAAPVVLLFIAILWSATMFNEKRRVPRTKEDFQELRADALEFSVMVMLVLGIFLLQVIVGSIFSGLLGITI